jgi:hypothetical protein
MTAPLNQPEVDLSNIQSIFSGVEDQLASIQNLCNMLNGDVDNESGCQMCQAKVSVCGGLSEIPFTTDVGVINIDVCASCKNKIQMLTKK